MGRPRKYDPSIPAHIDQRQLPTRIYWDRKTRTWYTKFKRGGVQHRARLAGSRATLADLHRLIEDLADNNKGSIAWLDARFRESDQYNQLSGATHRDYAACLRALERMKTKQGQPVAELIVDRLTSPLLQVLIDKIGVSRPAMANHVKRYLGRLIRWGMARGLCTKRENPAHGLDAAKEVGAFKMPSRPTMARAVAFARQCGQHKAHGKGSCPAYLWVVMVIAYRCRLRGIEILSMTEDAANADGVLAKRRKGSRTNRVRWSQELREAWDVAIQHRDTVWSARGIPVPMRPQERLLLVSDTGKTITRSALDSAWRRFTAMATKAGVLAPDEYFTLHGLKHRGITDSANKSDGGHSTEAMRNRYDHEQPLVDQAGIKKQ